jgi:hypothetical protein
VGEHLLIPVDDEERKVRIMFVILQ